MENPEHRCRGVAEAELDDEAVDPRHIPLRDDGQEHRVRIIIGASRPRAEREVPAAAGARAVPAGGHGS